jgi:hypothetical protein
MSAPYSDEGLGGKFWMRSEHVSWEEFVAFAQSLPGGMPMRHLIEFRDFYAETNSYIWLNPKLWKGHLHWWHGRTGPHSESSTSSPRRGISSAVTLALSAEP